MVLLPLVMSTDYDVDSRSPARTATAAGAAAAVPILVHVVGDVIAGVAGD